MKRLPLLLSVLLLTTTPLQLAAQSDTDDCPAPEPASGHFDADRLTDPGSLAGDLWQAQQHASRTTRGEYETTEKYDERLSAAQERWEELATDTFYVSFDPTSDYDADAQRLTSHLWHTLRIQLHRRSEQDRYTAANAFGVTREVTKQDNRKVLLKLDDVRLRRSEGPCAVARLSMSPGEAQELRDHLRVVAGFTKPHVEREVHRTRPTVNRPADVTTINRVITGSAVSLRLVDSRDGRVLAEWTRSDP